ncbi:small acid-soluble spore protein Tlp [Evansella cellulosilytica]|uniref:Small, acid-soluble spore protein Tlp n=1 Tax=Evansella cellulosilytica (strain ATCC 21833 / DSM 2522 / FERM P-1141 / JCM 9156 / N-4) TaxID=649639 RepID=E6U238_EVAC2|nr:small acid-soluble spore protein Tlp [Evansella cellulosilytica]ADU30416.1 small, acid-soluble spore protein tlp [Evansella cellulosilytica DSM 2522]
MAKPDNRKNNVERLQKMVENTKENMEAARETMDNEHLSASDKAAIESKNHRREESIESFKAEIADEKRDRENGEV